MSSTAFKAEVQCDRELSLCEIRSLVPVDNSRQMRSISPSPSRPLVWLHPGMTPFKGKVGELSALMVGVKQYLELRGCEVK